MFVQNSYFLIQLNLPEEKVDVYSFGTLVFFVLSGGNLPKIKIKERDSGKKAEIPSSFNEFSKKLLNECWNFNPKDRPSFQMILDDFERNHYNLKILILL